MGLIQHIEARATHTKVIVVHWSHHCRAFLFILMAAQVGDRAHAQYLSHAEVAARWAPIHYQDTDSTDYFSDLITRADYDADWVSANNWDNLHVGDYADPNCGGVIPICHDAHQYDLSGAVYFSVVETCTHWFITYDFFHPRDWDDGAGGAEHENDFEDVLVVVRKGADGGSLEALVAQAHGYYYSYLPAGSPLTAGDEIIDGTLPMAEYPAGSGQLHPETAQEAKGHGAGAKGYVGDFAGEPAHDGIIYWPKGVAELPTSGNDRNVGYELISFFESGGLWDRQLLEAAGLDSNTYFLWGTLRGDESGSCGSGVTFICDENSASVPWNQNDEDDDLERGVNALDPARFIQVYFNGLGEFDELYFDNRYMADMAAAGFGPGNIPDGYNGPTLDEAFYAKLAPRDADSDGLDRCQEWALGTNPEIADSDGDGVGDAQDALPLDPSESVDTDTDGIGDNADTDDDNDGFEDANDAFPTDPSEWADNDLDGTGDNADTDDDNDGLSDTDEVNVHGTDPLDRDTDDDLLDDRIEISTGVNPLNRNTDGDRLIDGKDVEWIQNAINSVPASCIKTPTAANRRAMLVLLDFAEAALLGAERGLARQLLLSLRGMMNGCGSVPDANDLIRCCSSQAQIRSYLDLLLTNLAMNP